MRIRLKPWAALVLLALAVSLILFGLQRYRYRFVQSDSDLLSLLPGRPATTFFVNVAALRQANVLSVFAGAAPVRDSEYDRFVRETGFDYTRDIDAIAGTMMRGTLAAVLRGRFAWHRLRSYAIGHGGHCQSGHCVVPSSSSSRSLSFYAVQPDVLAVAVAADRTAAFEIEPGSQHRISTATDAPVWIRIDGRVLKTPDQFPVPIRLFTDVLQPAESATLSLGSSDTAATFQLRLEAPCPSQPVADSIRKQLEIQTKLLKLQIARAGQQPKPSNLLSVLASGHFEVVAGTVIGTWPVPRELLDSLR